MKPTSWIAAELGDYSGNEKYGILSVIAYFRHFVAKNEAG